jgi:hypothetical protein
MGGLAPTSASMLKVDGAVGIVSAGQQVWFALVAAPGAGGFALLHDDDAGGDGAAAQIAHLKPPAGEATLLIGPFFSTRGLPISGIGSASVMTWIRYA